MTTRAGLFFSDVDGRPQRLAVGKNRLRIAGGPMLDALAADHFKAPRGSLSVLRYRRSAASAIIGLDCSNPLVRRVEFTRAGDCQTTR